MACCCVGWDHLYPATISRVTPLTTYWAGSLDLGSRAFLKKDFGLCLTGKVLVNTLQSLSERLAHDETL